MERVYSYNPLAGTGLQLQYFSHQHCTAYGQYTLRRQVHDMSLRGNYDLVTRKLRTCFQHRKSMTTPRRRGQVSEEVSGQVGCRKSCRVVSCQYNVTWALCSSTFNYFGLLSNCLLSSEYSSPTNISKASDVDMISESGDYNHRRHSRRSANSVKAAP